MDTRYGTPLWVVGHKVTPIKTTGDYALADVWATPKVPGPPPHHHAVADELYYVLEGTMEFMRGDNWHTVNQGESFKIPKGTLHSFRNGGDTPARFITVHDPGAGADALFLNYGVPAHEPDSFEHSVSDEVIAEFVAAASENDMIIQALEPVR